MSTESTHTILELTIKGADREFRTGVLPIESAFRELGIWVLSIGGVYRELEI